MLCSEWPVLWYVVVQQPRLGSVQQHACTPPHLQTPLPCRSINALFRRPWQVLSLRDAKDLDARDVLLGLATAEQADQQQRAPDNAALPSRKFGVQQPAGPADSKARDRVSTLAAAPAPAALLESQGGPQQPSSTWRHRGTATASTDAEAREELSQLYLSPAMKFNEMEHQNMLSEAANIRNVVGCLNQRSNSAAQSTPETSDAPPADVESGPNRSVLDQENAGPEDIDSDSDDE